MRKRCEMSEMVIRKIMGLRVSKKRALEIALSVLLALIFGAAIQ
mgnify:CR=1 FL=1